MLSKRLLILLGTVLVVFATNALAFYLFGTLLADTTFGPLEIDPTVNTGLALSLQAGSLSTILLPLATLAVLVWLYLKQPPSSTIAVVAFGLILGAGLANFFERVTTGGVLDYFRIGSLPTVNLADVLLTIGIALYIWKSLARENQS